MDKFIVSTVLGALFGTVLSFWLTSKRDNLAVQRSKLELITSELISLRKSFHSTIIYNINENVVEVMRPSSIDSIIVLNALYFKPYNELSECLQDYIEVIEESWSIHHMIVKSIEENRIATKELKDSEEQIAELKVEDIDEHTALALDKFEARTSEQQNDLSEASEIYMEHYSRHKKLIQECEEYYTEVIEYISCFSSSKLKMFSTLPRIELIVDDLLKKDVFPFV
jgi:DNA-directed RNA polymerase beta subunit